MQMTQHPPFSPFKCLWLNNMMPVQDFLITGNRLINVPKG
uniref:Uncharacterized protein n=1 Tax=Rhizophora mucronata TaxID=61149 RepID=A0A2P2N2G6_RHIMU